MIIHLNSMPGVGKLTIARVLAKELNAALIDNHAVINITYACHEHGSEGYLRMLQELTDVVFNHIAEKPKSDIFIFTNALSSELPEDRERFNNIKALSARRGDVFVPVLLTCDTEENVRRAQTPTRADRSKLTNPENLRGLIRDYTIFHPADEPHALAVDVTALTPEQSAGRICAHVKPFLR